MNNNNSNLRSSNKRLMNQPTLESSDLKKKRKTNNNNNPTFLSEEEKKARHIASEKKRRETIRLAFDKIVSLVPNLTPQESRTEIAILTKSSDFIDQLRYENLKLIDLLQKNNIPIPSHLLENYQKTNGSLSKSYLEKNGNNNNDNNNFSI